MPRLDQTGPAGAGPMTGRGMGPCALPAGRQGGGMGYGRGFGIGYGRGNSGRFARRNYLTKSEEVEDLEEEAKAMEADLKVLKEQISELKAN